MIFPISDFTCKKEMWKVENNCLKWYNVYKVYYSSHNKSLEKDHFEMFPQENFKRAIKLYLK